MGIIIHKKRMRLHLFASIWELSTQVRSLQPLNNTFPVRPHFRVHVALRGPAFLVEKAGPFLWPLHLDQCV